MFMTYYIRKSQPVQLQCRVWDWICTCVDKDSLLILRVSMTPRMGLRLGIPSQSPESVGWLMEDEVNTSGESCFSHTQLHTVGLGTSMFMLLFNKILTRFYFHLLSQLPS